MGSRAAIVWFQQNLRLQDNPVIGAALKHGGALIPVFIWSPQEEGAWAPGEAGRWWLHQSLARLHDKLTQRGSRLVIRQGESLGILRALVRETGADAVLWDRRFEPMAASKEAAITTALQREGLTAARFNASSLFTPGTVLNRQGRPYRVFTAFWRACLARPNPPPPAPAPARLPAPKRWPESLPLAALQLESNAERTAGFRAVWTPGEQGAGEQLDTFLDQRLAAYPESRDRPGSPGTSRLSPHLHFGEISPGQIWHAVEAHAGLRRQPGIFGAAAAFVRQLGWREFGCHLLWHFPHTVDEPMRPEFAAFPWRDDAEGLQAWQQGRTGYPLVDAGMRELWTTGWMHNRVRMVVASFLAKDLLLAWQTGAKWFWDTLVDADLANNTLGWQWTAGCGADAAPYFRIFHPVAQGRRYDPRGDYVRRWVPELRGLSDRWIHRPWEAPPAVLKAARVALGHTYPRPVVNHALARERALSALAQVKRG